MRVLFLLACGPYLMGADPAAEAARRWRESHERAIIDEFVSLLSIPNVARNLDDMRRNAAHIRGMMERRGVRTRLLEVSGAPPAIYGEKLTPGARRTLMFYVHYDGQPVEPSQWKDSGPFTPILRDGGTVIPLGERFDPEWRLYARSASDDKAPIIALMTALDAIQPAGLSLKSNVKFFLDGEEEAGSPNLGRILSAHRDLLKADVWIFCDGPVHQTRKQQIVFGVRGAMGAGITVYGPRRELHSGHYGNWAPNPAAMLTRLLASMRDDEGKVLVAGFYDRVRPLSESERQAIARMPDAAAELKRELWLGRTEGDGRRLEELVTFPSLNVRGLAAAGVGEQSRNVIPSEATASLDIRLVPDMDPGEVLELIRGHARKQGYHVVDREPDAETRMKHPKLARITSADGYRGVRASMDSDVARDVIRAVEAARGEVILTPILGGSLPIAPIVEVLKAPVIIVPIANHDNNQHGHNENIRIRNLWDGIETMAALLTLH